MQVGSLRPVFLKQIDAQSRMAQADVKCRENAAVWPRTEAGYRADTDAGKDALLVCDTAAQPATAAIIARRIRADTMRVASKNDGADGDTAAA